MILSFLDVYFQRSRWREYFLTLFDDLRAVPIQNSDIINSYISWTSALYDAFYDKLWQNILLHFFFQRYSCEGSPWLMNSRGFYTNLNGFSARLLVRWAAPQNTDSVFIGLALYRGQSWTNYDRNVPLNMHVGTRLNNLGMSEWHGCWITGIQLQFISAIVRPRNRAPIEWQISARRNNQNRDILLQMRLS